MKVTANPVDGGYVINGVKTWCTFAGRADTLMLLARTDPDRSLGHRGLSVFVVEKPPAEGHHFAFDDGREGKMEGRAIDTLGYRGMHSYEVAFDNWFVPAENLIGLDGGLGKGFYLQMEGFENGRLQTAARAVGLMQAAFEAGLAYAQERNVFGKPVFDYQLSKVKLAKMAALICAGRQFSYDVARKMARGEGALEASMVKAYVCRAAEWVDPRGAPAARRHGLRRGVPGVALLRRRPRALDLRGRRRDAVPPRDRPPPHRAGPHRLTRALEPRSFARPWACNSRVGTLGVVRRSPDAASSRSSSRGRFVRLTPMSLDDVDGLRRGRDRGPRHLRVHERARRPRRRWPRRCEALVELRDARPRRPVHDP